MHITNEPAPFDVAHDVLDRSEGVGCCRLVVHRQEDASNELDHQDYHRQYTKNVPPVEILGRVVLGDVILHRLRKRETIINPFHESTTAGANFRFDARHYADPASEPIMITSSRMYR